MNRPRKPGDDTLLTIALRKGRSALGYAALFSLVTNLLYLALPIYTNQIYGRVLTSGSVPTLLVLTGGTVFVFIISGILDNLRARVLSGYGVALDQQVSGHVFAALFDGVVRRDSAAGAQALRDLDGFRQTLTGPAVSVIFDLPWIPIYMLILFMIDPVVGLVTLVGGVILVILAFVQDRMTRPLTREANSAAIKSYSFTEAGLRNSEVVRAMGMLGFIGRKWAKFRLESLSKTEQAARQSEFWSGLIRFVRTVIQVLIIAVGADLIINHKIGAGMLFANMILSGRALAPIDRIVGSWTALVTAGQSYERLNALLRDYTPAASATELPRPKGALTVEGLNYGAPGSGRLLLAAVNFSLQPGEFLGVIGPSGAGKSTLARLLVGVHQPLNGSVRLDGVDVFNWSRADFGRYVGYLPQDTELFAGSVRDNIARFMADVTDDEVLAAAQAAGVHDLIVRLPKGYDTELGVGGVVLSAGQRQRVGLARAMLRAPPLIVLDEPNANLDAQGEEALLKALKVMKARGQTVVVVSHKPSMLQDADKLLVIRDGRVDMFGPRAAVLERLNKNAAAAIPAAPPAIETKS
ncbi:type I secretion system permease/ATPase [Caulobacter segnis]|uniref:type I secretion system permease/ATPase n=1 Tax=Caulobacter segnis TaxID=88688 RepID=UPI002854C7D4|nr:type I secretion system permease/ATPase [Caulobacter segnis]MDR6628001.1 PrtD family type I secretion system ABC transporter [Caulobacter segnis]